MNIILNALIIFIFLTLLGCANIPNYSDLNRVLYQKFILFISIFSIQLLILLIYNIMNKKVIEFNNLLLNCLESGLSAVLAYMIILDWNTSNGKINLENKYNLIIFNIVFVIVFIKSIKLLFTTNIE